MFKVIEEKKTCIKAKHKVFSNFALIKSNTKSKKKALKKKKKLVKWSKYKKCGYKHLINQLYKYINEKCDKYYKKGYISYFYNSYISLNKEKTLEILVIFIFNFKKNISCIT